MHLDGRESVKFGSALPPTRTGGRASRGDPTPGAVWRSLALVLVLATGISLGLDLMGLAGPWTAAALALAAATFACVAGYAVTQRRHQRVMADGLAQARLGAQTVTELRQEIDRHTQLETELMQAKQAAEAAAMAKGEFLATMSHEIRTPLNGIVPTLDLLLGAPLAAEHRDLVRTAFTSSQQLLRIVDDILDYSKLEANRLVLETTNFNLRELLDTVLEMLQRSAEAKGLRLALQLDPNVRLPVRGDPVRLRQVLTNLLGNAIKFTERGSVTLAVRRLGETAAQHRLRFEVRDTGIGISPNAQAGLFNAFSQADASTTRLYGGTGLGLAICKRIVELMQGQIGVDSQPQRGSTFWFEIPLLKVQGDITGAARGQAEGARMLLVTSDPRLRTRLGMLLPSWGYRISVVESTAEALDCLRSAAGKGASWAFDAVIADFARMRGSALSLQRKLEQPGAFGKVRLIGLYGDDYAPDELRQRSALLSRQAPDAELRKALNECLREASTPGSSATPADPAQTPMAQGASFRNARVLLVEDNPVNLMVGQRLLAVLGVNCDAAPNGEAALLRMSACNYDMVLMDCQMPVLDGYAATRRWRENEAAGGAVRRLPIIALTANAMAGDRQKCIDAGMDDYLAKPVTRLELERCLFRWCRQREKDAPPSDQCGAVPATGPAGEKPETESSPITPAATAQASSAAGELAPRQQPSQVAKPEPPVIAPVDLEVLSELRQMLGRELHQLVDVFLDDAPKLIARLETAALRPDYAQLVQAAHSLKSSSANLGAMPLSAAARRIESGARTQTLERPAVAVALVSEEFARARLALLDYTQSNA